MNGICILVPQANLSDGGFAKLAPLPHPFFYLFIFFFYFIFVSGRVVGLVGLPLSPFQLVMGILGRG